MTQYHEASWNNDGSATLTRSKQKRPYPFIGLTTQATVYDVVDDWPGCSIPSLMWRCRLTFVWQSLAFQKRQSVKSYVHDLFHSNGWRWGFHSCSWCPTIAMKNPWASCCASNKTQDPPFLRLNVMSGISEMSFQRKKQSSSWWTNQNGKENDAILGKSP